MSLSSIQLDAFVMVAQTRNFSKAAERLNITQSALSQRVLNLEEELGVALFIRERTGVRMTEAAESLLRYCQIRESLEDEFVSALKTKNKKSLSGQVRIAGFSSVMRSLIVPALSDLILAHPELGLQAWTRELRELPILLRTAEVDFIVTDQKPDSENLEFHFLGEERNILVRSKFHPEVDVYLDHDEEDQTTFRFMKLARLNSSKVKRRYLDDIYGLVDGVRQGLGKAVLPEHLIASEDFKNLSPESVLKIPIYLVYYKQPYYSQVQQSVVKTLRAQVPLILKS